MRRYLSTALLLTGLAFMPAGEATANPLPPELELVRAQIISISRENTTRVDNIAEVRLELEPLIAQLAAWFSANRPADEVALTQQPWQNIWYDDPTIDEFSYLDLGPISVALDREQIYQVVEDGYYYNVSESTITLFGFPVRMRSFLKGAYTLANPADEGNVGQDKLNVVDLEFVENSVRVGALRAGVDLRRLVHRVETGWMRTQAVPGPIGITGELWNLYVDNELRISAGFEDLKPDVLDLYILLRSEKSGPLP